MGLDMYLTGKLYFYSDDEKRKALQAVTNSPFKAEAIDFEVGYWRKANAIHQWFVKHVQGGKDDCSEYYVSEEHLRALLKDVNTVLKYPDAPEVILPTQEGFFFGSVDYGEGYMDDLKLTKEIIERFLNYEDRSRIDLQYHSSW